MAIESKWNDDGLSSYAKASQDTLSEGPFRETTRS